MFSAHMGWADLAAAIPIGERAALAAIRADSEDPWAHYASGFGPTTDIDWHLMLQ
jgi:hypothetical protein